MVGGRAGAAQRHAAARTTRVNELGQVARGHGDGVGRRGARVGGQRVVVAVRGVVLGPALGLGRLHVGEVVEAQHALEVPESPLEAGVDNNILDTRPRREQDLRAAVLEDELFRSSGAGEEVRRGERRETGRPGRTRKHTCQSPTPCCSYMGTSTAPRPQHAWPTTGHSRVLREMMATRSPRVTPMAASAPRHLDTCSSSSPKVEYLYTPSVCVHTRGGEEKGR